MAQPFIIAHRGASGSAPENTIPAFKKGIDAGADMLELDIHQTKDGYLVVLHDETVNRTSNGRGLVRKLNLNQIKELDAGTWYDKKFAGTEIPTLEELFKLVFHSRSESKPLRLLIEVKGSGKKYPGIEKNLIETIHKYNASDWCIVQSFNKKILQTIAELDPSITLHHLIIGKIFPRKIPSYINAVNINFHFASHKKIEKLHLQKKTIFVWTVNNVDQMKKMVSKGVDGIITNYPEKLNSLIK